MVKQKIIINKQQIISEYLTGGATFVELSANYGVNARTIQSWVRVFRSRHPENVPGMENEREADIKSLKKQLVQATLKNELLEEMLRLAEEQAGIDFKKKFGSGQ